MQTLRFGLFGCGFMGRKHAANLAALPGVELVAAASARPDSAAALLAVHGAPDARAFPDFDTLLAEADLDAVIFAVPPGVHDGEVEAAAARGWHVFLEKPVALTGARAASQRAAVERAGVHAQVGYHLRFLPAIRRLEEWLASGEAGRPLLFQGLYRCNHLHAPWWRDRARSGGQVLEQAIHTYNLALSLLGDAPVSVSGAAVNLAHREVEGYTIEDNSAAIIRCAGGALASLCATNCAVPMEWVEEFTFVSERLTFFHRSGRAAEVVFTDPARREILPNEVDPYAAEIAHFVATIRGGAAPLCPLAEGERDVRAALAVFASSDQGGAPVAL